MKPMSALLEIEERSIVCQLAGSANGRHATAGPASVDDASSASPAASSADGDSGLSAPVSSTDGESELSAPVSRATVASNASPPEASTTGGSPPSGFGVVGVVAASGEDAPSSSPAAGGCSVEVASPAAPASSS